MALSENLHMERYYVDGYQPSSFDAPHSSLQRSLTWIGMGFWLLLMPGLGTIVFGLATNMSGTQDNAMMYLITGVVISVVSVVAGSACIHAGRKNYRYYKGRSGRII